ELAGGLGMGHHAGDAARLVGDDPGDVEQADDDDHHLHEVGPGHRIHAAPQRVDDHHRGADDDAGLHRHRAGSHDVEHQADDHDLRRQPAEVGNDDGHADQHFGDRVVAHAVIVADGQQVHPVELRREKQADEDQAEAG